MSAGSVTPLSTNARWYHLNRVRPSLATTFTSRGAASMATKAEQARRIADVLHLRDDEREGILVSKDGVRRAYCWHSIRLVAGQLAKIDHSGSDSPSFLQGVGHYVGQARPQSSQLALVRQWAGNDELWPPYLEDEVLGNIDLNDPSPMSDTSLVFIPMGKRGS